MAGDLKTQNETLKQISKSGYPFQLKVEDEIRMNNSSHHW